MSAPPESLYYGARSVDGVGVMQVKCIETMEAFVALKDNWEAVFAADPHAQHFLSHGWLRRFLARKKRWFILALKEKDPGAPFVAFFPLRLQTRQDKDGLFFDEIVMAGNYAADYTGFLCLPEYERYAVAGFCKVLRQQVWKEIKLDYFNGPPERREAVIRALEGPRVMFRRRTPLNEQKIDATICPQIHLPESWDTYLERHMSSQTRQKLRRFLRKVEGGDEFRITHADAATIDRDLTILFDFWRTRWSPVKGVERTEELIRSTRQMLMDCFEEGDLDVPVLWHGERPLAALANIVDAGKKAIRFYITGRDETWTTPSPGLILHGYCIRRAIADGFRLYDFLRGNEPYKYMFGVEEHRISCVEFKTRDGKNLGGKLNPNSIDFVYRQALDFNRRGKRVDAERAFRQVVEAAPDHLGAEFGLANLQVLRGNLPEAEEAFRALLPRTPDPRPVLMRLADVCLARSAYPRAIEALRDVLRLEPYKGEALYKLGVASLVLGERDAARQAWSQLVEHGAPAGTRTDYVEKARRALNRLPVARRPNRGILVNPPPAPAAGIDVQAFLMMTRRKTGAAFLN